MAVPAREVAGPAKDAPYWEWRSGGLVDPRLGKKTSNQPTNAGSDRRCFSQSNRDMSSERQGVVGP